MLQVGDLGAVLRLDRSQFDRGLSEAGTKFEGWGSTIQSKAAGIGSAIGGALKTGVLAGGSVIAGAATLGIKSFVDYESGLADVAKTSGLAGAELAALGDGLRKMSTDSGRAVTGLEAMAAIAGQMGITGTKDILKFTETVNQASIAFGMAPEAAANALAKVGNIWDIPTAEAYKMGSAINYLGNTSAVSESQLFDFMLNIGNQPRLLGLSSMETLKLGEMLVAMGQDASDAGTRLNSAFGNAGLLGHLPAAAKQLGMTEEAFRKMADASPIDTILKLVDSIGQIPSRTERASAGAEVFGQIGWKALSGLIGRTQDYRDDLANVNIEYEKGTSMANEYQTRLRTLGNQLSRIKSGFNDIAIEIGAGLAPYVGAFADLMNNEVLPGVKEFTAALMSGDWEKVGDSLHRGIKYGFDKVKRLGTELFRILKNIKWRDVGTALWNGIKWGVDQLKSIGGTVLGYLQSVDWSSVGSTLWSGLLAGMEALQGIGAAIVGYVTSIDWSAVGNTIYEAVNAGLGILGELGGQAFDWLKGIDVKQLGNEIYNSVADGLRRAAEFVSNYTWPGTIIQGLMGDWTAFDRMKDTLLNIFDSVKTAAMPVFDGIKTAALEIGNHVKTSLDNVDFKSIGENAATGIKNAIETLKNIGDTVAEYIRKGLKRDFKGDASNVAKTIKNGLSTLNSYWTDFKEGFTTKINWKAEASAIGEKIKGGFKEVVGFFTTISDKIQEEFTAWVAANGPYNLGYQLGQKIAEGAEQVGSWIQNAISEAFEGEDAAGFLVNQLYKAADFAAAGVSAVGQFISGFASGIAPLGQHIYNAVVGAVANAIEGIPYLGKGPAEALRGKMIDIQPGTPYAAQPVASSAPVPVKEEKPRYGPAGAPDYPGHRKGAKAGDWYWTGTEWIDYSVFRDSEEAAKAPPPVEMTAADVQRMRQKETLASATTGPTMTREEAARAWLQLRGGKPEQLFMEPPEPAASRPQASVSYESGMVTVRNPDGSLAFRGRDMAGATKAMASVGYTADQISSTIGIDKSQWENFNFWKVFQEGEREWRKSKGDALAADQRRFELETQKYNNTMAALDRIQQEYAAGAIEFNRQTGEWERVAGRVAEVEEQKIEQVEREAEAAGELFDSAERLAVEQYGVLSRFGDYIKSSEKTTASNVVRVTGAADYAARALSIGAEVGSKFTTDAGQKVAVAFDTATGKFSAHIGSAGEKLTNSADYNLERAREMGAVIINSGNSSGNSQRLAASQAGLTTISSASQAASSITSGASEAQRKIAATGDVGSKLVIGAQYAASAIVSAGSSFAAAVRGAASMFSNASYFRNPFENPQYKTSWRATGTKTSGPELAVIGEDGPSWPEFVIPTKTKRWDLLAAAMQAYGIPGYAEGTATGPVPSGSDTAGFSGSITISIGKLAASTAKTLSQIINSFRTSWAVIKADTSKHWLALIANTATEMGQFRDVVTTSVGETRTAVISNWRALATDGLTIWTEGGAAIRQQAAYLADQIKMSADNTRIAVQDLWNATKDELNNGIMELQTVWQTGWQKMDSDLAAASANIKSKVQEIAALLKSISGANVNISVGGFIGGGGGGGGGGGRGGGGGSAADQFINQYFGDTTCQIDELSGMSPGLIESLAKSGAWKPNEHLASQMIAQAIGYGTSAKQIFSNESWSGGISRQINNPQYAPSGGASRSSSFSSAVRNVGGVLKIGKYDAGGISAQPQLAIVSGRGEPEIHLTKSNIREFFGDVRAGGDTIVQVVLDGRVIAEQVMNRASGRMRLKGFSTR